MKKFDLKEKILSKFPDKKREKIEKFLKVSNIIKNVICWALVAILAVTLVIFVTTRMNGETPSIFGYTVQRVSSGSMEPTLEVGDVILSKRVDDVDSIKIDDIITFKGDENYDNNFVTHRVIVAPYSEGGVKRLQTKGDANEIADSPILAEDVFSIYVGKLAFLNWLYNLFFTPWGLIIFIAVLLILFFDEIINIIRIMTGRYDEEEEETIGEIMERIQREDNEKKLAEAQKQLEAEQHRIAEREKSRKKSLNTDSKESKESIN